MNTIDSVEAVSAIMPVFAPHERVIAVIIAYIFIRKIVSVGSQEEQYERKFIPFPFLPLNYFIGALWGTLALIVLLYDILTKILHEDIAGSLNSLLQNFGQLPFVQWFAQLSLVQSAGDIIYSVWNSIFIQIFVGFLFPIPSSIMGAIGKYLTSFAMLTLLFVLELIVHREIRRRVCGWLKMRFSGIIELYLWLRGWAVAKRADKQPEKQGQPEQKQLIVRTGREKESPARKKAKKIPPQEQKRPWMYDEMYDYNDDLRRCFLKEECKWQRVFFQIALLAILIYHFFENTSAGTTMFPLYAMTEFWMMSMVHTRREVLEKDQKQDGTEERKDRLKKVVDEISAQERFAAAGEKKPVIFLQNNDAVYAPSGIDARHQKTHEDKLIEQYFSACRRTGVKFDPMFELPAKELLRGKSVVFSTRFYEDMDYSFYLPMLRVMQSGYRCLLVTGDPIDMRQMEGWLLNGRRHIIGDTPIWKLEQLDLRGRQAYTDIGYITAEDLSNTKIMRENSAFFSKVRLVLIVNASSLLHKQLFGIMRLRKMLHQSCTFAICNDNAVGLTDIYSHLLQTELNLVIPTTAMARRSYFLFCDDDDIPGSDLLTCRQIMLGRALLQADADAVEKVYWYSGRVTPVKDIAGQHGMLQSADEYDPPADQSGKLVAGVDDADCPREDFACVIVEDEIYNPAELGMQFASRGREDAVVAVFSPKYFLRDYIRFHFKKFHAVFKKIIQTFPAYCMSERNAVLQMMWNMERVRLDEDDIRSLCVLLGQKDLERALWPQGYIDPNVLIQKFSLYTNISDMEYYLHYEHKFEYEKVAYEFWIDPIPCSQYDRKRPCYCVCSVFGPNRRILPQYSKIQLMQAYLPGQVISLAGQSYEVMDIVENDSDVEMFVRRSAQSLRLRQEYHQKREIKICGDVRDKHKQSYSFQGTEQEPAHQLLLKQLTASKIEVITQGYWTIYAEDENASFTPLDEDVQRQTRHSFYQKDFLCVELDGTDSEHNTHMIMQGLAFTLNELFRTVYAEYHCQLLICTISNNAEGLLALENLPWGTIQEEQTEHNRFYIIEDSEEDIGLLDSIMLHFERLLHIITEVDSYYNCPDRGSENA